jgi:hypothetical protein
MEIMRKDIKCVFGILKKRFRILKCAFFEFEPARIDRAMKVCAILQSMFIKSSGLANVGHDAKYWSRVDIDIAQAFGFNLSGLDTLLLERQRMYDKETLHDEGYDEKWQALVSHYAFTMLNNDIENLIRPKILWPRLKPGLLKDMRRRAMRSR